MLSRHLREPFSGLSHLLGALLSCAGLGYMLMHLPPQNAGVYLASYLSFGLSMIIMFSSSAIYHLVEASDLGIKKLKRVDHMAIFIMIAGSYTPFILLGLKNSLATVMFAVIWGIALFGILVKIYWLHAPRWLSTALYLGMGWVAMIVYQPLSENLPSAAIDWLIYGGLAYTLGAVVYACKWPNLHPNFNFHDFWHLFVLAGAAAHFVSIGLYL
jgi:hemolysin III